MTQDRVPSPFPASEQNDSELARATGALLALGQADMKSSMEPLLGRRLHVLEVGEGEPVVLLHGAGGGGANWFLVVSPLSRRFRVVAPDLPGFGFSEGMPFRRPLGMSVAAALKTWLDGRGEGKVHLVGTSLGGLIALRLAQRLGPRVISLTLVDSAGLGREIPLPVRIATLPGLRPLAGSTSRLGLSLFFRTYLTSTEIPGKRRTALLDYLLASSRAGAGRTVKSQIGSFGSLRGQREVLDESELRAIETRTLVLWGARDRFLPVEHGRRAASCMPRGTFVKIPEAGHSPNWEAPDQVADAIFAFA